MKPMDDINLKKNLTAAFHAVPEFEISALWQQNTMRCIRGIGVPDRHSAVRAGRYGFAELVWKMTPAFCVLLILLITGIFSLDLSVETVINDAFIDDPVVAIYSGIFWG
jgi:hypothetical protein